MKSIILFLICCSVNICQPEGFPVEIFIGTENINLGQEVEFNLQTDNAVWGAVRVSPTENEYYLTHEFVSSIYNVPINNNEPNDWAGWDFVLSQTTGNTYPVYAYGIYKLYYSGHTRSPRAYFFLDFRDDRLGNYKNYSPPSFGHDIDIWIKFDGLTSQFYLTSDISFSWGEPIATGDTLSIWEIKQKGNPSTSKFPLYMKISTFDDHPHLTWNPFNDENIIGYRVYKKLTADGETMTNYVNTTNTEYIDYDFTLNQSYQGDLVEYWVKARIDAATESLESNHVSTNGESNIHWKRNPGVTEGILEYQLEQNYPNPFNPSTSIIFTLPQNEFVKVKVFNQMGEEVALLVNGQMSSGTHSIDFNGSELASGIYFYQISAGKFNEVKKMILLK